jgi:tetratricopeptide (TPR) repeat protein
MLKKNQADEYEFEETTPAVIGYILFGKEKFPEAIRFFELSLNEYPKGVYAGISYQYLGKCFEKTGDIKQAIKNYKNLLKLDPRDYVTAKTIKDLEKK